MSDSGKITKAVTLHTCLTCADIPSVQNQIDLLTPMLLEEYDDQTESTLDAMLLDLEDFLAEEPEEDDHTFFISALWLSTLRDMGTIDPEVERAALIAGRTLTRSGATEVGAPLTGVLREIAQPSADDLAFWYRRVLVTDSGIRVDFERLLRDFLAGDRGTAARLSLIENLRQLLLRGRRSVVVALDLWAYRWHSIGAFEGLVNQYGPDANIVAFNNPPTGPDAKTTPFCRWVHGQVIEVKKARRQIQAFLDAVGARDATAAMEAWPILSSTEASGEGVSFEVSFRRQALPPYHFFCRTVPRAAR
jgi:hypothetical protein